MLYAIEGRLERNVFSGAAAAVGLDRDGVICASDPLAAKLLGGSKDELLGKPIATLIPGLPLHRDTQGYNFAYVGLWFANGVRRRVQGLKLDGETIPLEISIAIVGASNTLSFLVGLRQAPLDPGLQDRLEAGSEVVAVSSSQLH